MKKGDGAEKLVKLLRHHFMTYGASDELATDGGLDYVSNECQTFLRQWGVHHRLSSAYYPHSNNQSEVAVKLPKGLSGRTLTKVETSTMTNLLELS